jgi:uncharacterized membrane-anchored protein YhcB (DUF1043 family)
MSNKLSVAVVGVSGFAAGILAGFLIAALASRSLIDLTTERNRLEKQVATLSSDKTTLQREKTALIRRRAEQDKKMDHSAEELNKLQQDLARSRATCTKFSTGLLKSQAIIGAIRHRDNTLAATIVSILRDDNFRAKFSADWFFPETAMELIGVRWFGDELVEKGVISQSVLDGVDAEERAREKRKTVANLVATEKWVMTQQWETTGNKTTDDFAIQGKKWRVRWQSDRFISVNVIDHNGTFVGGGSGEGSDSSVMHYGPGRFHLLIIAAGQGKVSVDEPSP